MRKDLHEENRLSWNAATDAHNSHKENQAQFFKEGGSTLYPEEVELLGNLEGKRVLHLQCNSGQDALSLAGLGADVTGVDISDTAVDFANRLSAESGIPVRFVRSDVYDWLAGAASSSRRYDAAFSSYGALIWLSSLDTWATGVARILRPGGQLVLVDFHPLAMTFDYDWSHRFPYFGRGKVMTWEDGVGDYVAMSGPALAPSGYKQGVKSFENPYRCHEFQYSVTELITAVLDAGLSLEAWLEYPYMNGARLFEGMVESTGGRMYPPAGKPNLPLMYGLVARKPDGQ
ncbi:MAG: class I SAM-dependent methyltransferase [Chloroflexota bacterium]|nr:MAG: class I SAM-dependent methyltransferase [Chloroflexota bacterium]